MGIADAFKDLADKAKEKLSGAHPTQVEDAFDTAAGAYDNAADNRYAAPTDRGSQAINERIDDISDGEKGTNRGRQ